MKNNSHNTTNVVCFLQARMDSSRFPGKILEEINEKPMIILILDAISKSSFISKIVVLTSKNPTDNVLIECLKKHQIEYFRGSENDVLDRFYQAAKKFNPNYIVRLTADNPLIDPQIIDQVIETILLKKADYVSNDLERSFPFGYDVEVFSYTTLEKLVESTHDPLEREHVTLHIRKNKDKYKVENIEAPEGKQHPEWRLTVDERDDLELIRKIFDALKEKDVITYDDVEELIKKQPELLTINKHVMQKKVEN